MTKSVPRIIDGNISNDFADVYALEKD